MPNLFCDWNGTLLNDTAVWEKVMREVFLSQGKTPPAITEFFYEAECSDYITPYRKRGITASREELNEIYKQAYQKRIKKLRLFPKVKKTLKHLKKKGVRLFIVSAQLEELALPFVEKFGIADLFEEIHFHTINKTETLINIINKLTLNTKECFFVGDTPSDIRSAKKAGITAIAFLGGYIPEDLLKSAGADFFIESFNEITSIVLGPVNN